LVAEAGGAAAGAAKIAALRAIHARLIGDRSLQSDFAEIAKPKPTHEPAWLKVLGQWLAGAIKMLTPYAIDLFWVGVGAAVLAALYLIGREILGARLARRRRDAVRHAPVDWRPESWKARALLEEADRLAARGLYVEAARVLLWRGIDDIEARRPRLVRPALTARDIAALDELPPEARGAFARIAAAVEMGLFAGRGLNAEAFALARAAYEDFAFLKAWT
jgi:hypothetical protein